MRNEVFISYAHEDQTWLAQLQTVLRPLVRNQTVNVWDDTLIEAGQKWEEAIHAALDRARVAVLLVSPDFLASKFVNDEELPAFLRAATAEGLRILWVPVRSCMFDETPLKDYQATHDPARPLADMTQAEVDRALVVIGKAIKKALEPAAAPVTKPANVTLPPAPVPPPAPLPVPDQPDDAIPFTPPPATLLDILPGEWQIEIQSSFPAGLGQMRLLLSPQGQFHGELTTPLGQSVVEGRWEANPFTQLIGLQGRQSLGFQAMPYAVVIQVSYWDAQQVVGLTSGGEQVVWRKAASTAAPPPRSPAPRQPPRL